MAGKVQRRGKVSDPVPFAVLAESMEATAIWEKISGRWQQAEAHSLAMRHCL